MDFRNKSERITEGLRRSFENPDCKMANRTCYGYDTLSNGEPVINEAEAQTVRWISDCYLAGTSLGKIAAGLEKLGIPSPTGRAKWSRETISKLLSNEKYTGCVLLQKTLSICGAQFKNEGELQKVLVRNHHQAIISSQDFEKVQQLKNERAKSPVEENTMRMSF